jgi:fructose-bisphosphate aldolase class 1
MTARGLHAQQLQKMQTQPGFIAALDQSGGSTPNALRLYGIKDGAWANEEEMFALVHQMRTRLIEELNALPGEQLVMLKLTLPEHDNCYAACVSHSNVGRVVALSGGYTRDEANRRLRRQHGIVASFSRALVEGLTAQQSEAEFNARLDTYIQSIFEASNT